MRELYWVANYSDKTRFEQFNAEGKERKYADIDRGRLVRFDMVDKETNKAVYAMYIHAGQRLIFRRRTLKQISREGINTIVVFLVGYQETVMTLNGAKNITVINYIHPDGSISLDDHRNNLEMLDFER